MVDQHRPDGALITRRFTAERARPPRAVGALRGVTVSSLESGGWEWTAWLTGQSVASSQLTGTEASASAAQDAGKRALERLVSEAAAAVPPRIVFEQTG
jgi:hypothetical protein